MRNKYIVAAIKEIEQAIKKNKKMRKVGWKEIKTFSPEGLEMKNIFIEVHEFEAEKIEETMRAMEQKKDEIGYFCEWEAELDTDSTDATPSALHFLSDIKGGVYVYWCEVLRKKDITDDRILGVAKNLRNRDVKKAEDSKSKMYAREKEHTRKKEKEILEMRKVRYE